MINKQKKKDRERKKQLAKQADAGLVAWNDIRKGNRFKLKKWQVTPKG